MNIAWSKRYPDETGVPLSPKSQPYQNVSVLKINNKSDRRREARRDYSGFILFATDKHVCEGILRNFSRSGIHIQSDIRVNIGDSITIALPYLDDKRIGQIVWRSSEGFGVKLRDTNEAAVSPSGLYHRISSRVIRLFRTNA
jgi:hypothetical protein